MTLKINFLKIKKIFNFKENFYSVSSQQLWSGFSYLEFQYNKVSECRPIKGNNMMPFLKAEALHLYIYFLEPDDLLF